MAATVVVTVVVVVAVEARTVSSPEKAKD